MAIYRSSRRYGRKRYTRRGSKLKPLLYAKRKTIKNIVRVGETISKRSISRAWIQEGVSMSMTDYCFFGLDGNAFSNVYPTTLLSSTQPQLGGDNIRLSSKIMVTSFELRYNITSGDETNRVRIIVLRSLGGMLGGDYTNFFLVNSTTTQPINLPINTGTCFVYYDKIHTVSRTTSTIIDYESPQIFKKCPLELDYKKNNLSSGNLDPSKCDKPFYVITCSDSGLITHPILSGYVKFNYISV